MYVVLIMSFLYGIVIGSFLNVVIYRIPAKKKLTGRSHCPNCNHKLGPLELVPIFSYLALGKKCKSCNNPISPRYMSVELLTGILFTVYGFVLVQYGEHLMYSLEFLVNLLIGWVIISSLVSLAFIDFDTMEIPDRFHVILIISGVIMAITNNDPIKTQLISALAIGVPLFLIAFFTPGLGFGDVKLLFTSGLMFGLYNANLGLLIGCFSALIYTAIVRVGRGIEFPFGPHLAVGMYGALLITVGNLL